MIPIQYSVRLIPDAVEFETNGAPLVINKTDQSDYFLAK